MTLDELKSNVWAIESIENPTEEMCIYAVTRAWNTLRYIKNPSDDVVRRAVESKGWAIQYVKNPTEEFQLLAVNKDWDSIRYIDNPSREVMMAAVNSDWRAIQYIKNPPMEVKRAAVAKNEEAARYIEVNENDAYIYMGDNIKVMKYIGHAIQPCAVEDVLKKKIGSEDVEKKYIVDFIECEALEMDKVRFIGEYGSKKAKKVLVDYKLSLWGEKL